MKKKGTALLLAMGMLVSLVGCGKADDSKKTATTPTKAAEANVTDPTEAPVASEPIDLTMWCIATESDSNRHAYEAAIADFQAAHPEINFTWEAIQNQEYKTKIKAAVSANEMPDIFFTWGGGFLREFVDAERVYCVDDAYAKYAAELPDSMMSNVKVDGKYYGAPTTFNIVVMFSNMELLKEAGFDKVPATYDELIACCDALVAKGISPFGCSGKETWAVSEYLESIIQKSAGAAALGDMFGGKASWNNEDVAKAVDIMQDMISKNYFDPSGIALSNDEVKANFIAGKYAFYINGSWNAADCVKAGIQDKVQIAEFPVIDSSKSQLGELIGGPNDTLAVAASSKNAAVAAESAFELAKGICHYGYLDGTGLPAWTPDYDTSSINPLTQTVAAIVANSKQLVLFGDTYMYADDANVYLDYVSKVYASAVDGKAFIEGLAGDLQ